MKIYEVHLAEEYPFLAKDGADPRLVCFVQDYERVRDVTASPMTRPAVLVVPGGGYTHYGPMEGDPVALEFLNRGFQAFILYYSVKPYHFPQQTLELASAMDYLHKNADSLRIDKQKIAQIGFSAGGHMLASYAALLDSPEVAAHIRGIPANAAILGYPTVDAGDPCQRSCTELFVGHPLTDEEIERFSPSLHIGPNTPPTFLWHTATDQGVSFMNSVKYACALVSAGIKTELHIYPEGPHALSTATRQTVKNPHSNIAVAVSSWVDLAMRFLSQLFDL